MRSRWTSISKYRSCKTRYYLEVLEGWRDSRALFTFGTPYRSSLKAVNFLANGYKQQFIDLTEVMRSLTSIYQLLPIYEVVKIGESYKHIAEADGLPNIDKGKAQDALAFHREIEAAVEQHLKLEEYRQSFTVVPIAGVQQPTLQSAILEKGKLTARFTPVPLFRSMSLMMNGLQLGESQLSYPLKENAGVGICTLRLFASKNQLEFFLFPPSAKGRAAFYDSLSDEDLAGLSVKTIYYSITS